MIPVLLPRRDYTKASPQPVWLVFLLASGLRLQSGDDQYYVLVCDPSALTKKRLPEGLTPTSMACVSPGFRTPSSIGRWSILHSGCDPSALTKKVCDPSASTKKRLPQGLTPTSMACVSPDFRTLVFNREMINVMFWKIWDPSAFIKKRLHQGLTPTSVACVSPIFRTLSSFGRWSMLCSRRFGITSHLPRRDYPKASPQPVWLVCLPASGLRLQSGDDQYYVLVCDPIALIKKRLHQGLTPTSMACVSPIFRTLSSIGRWSVLYSRRFGSTSHLPRRDYPKVSPQPVWIACLPASGLHLQSGDDQCYVLVCDPSALTKKRLPESLTPTSMGCVSPRFRTPSSIGRWSMLCSRRFGIPTASTKKRLHQGLTPSSMACVSPGFRTPSLIGRLSILHSGCDPSALTKKRLPEGLTPHPNQYGFCFSWLQDSVFNREIINIMSCVCEVVWHNHLLVRSRLQVKPSRKVHLWQYWRNKMGRGYLKVVTGCTRQPSSKRHVDS